MHTRAQRGLKSSRYVFDTIAFSCFRIDDLSSSIYPKKCSLSVVIVMIKVAEINKTNINDVFQVCSPNLLEDQAIQKGTRLKREWIKKTLEKYGPFTKIAYLNDEPVAGWVHTTFLDMPSTYATGSTCDSCDCRGHHGCNCAHGCSHGSRRHRCHHGRCR